MREGASKDQAAYTGFTCGVLKPLYAPPDDDEDDDVDDDKLRRGREDAFLILKAATKRWKKR